MDLMDIWEIIIFILMALVFVLMDVFFFIAYKKNQSAVNDVIKEDYFDTGDMIVIEKDLKFEFEGKQFVPLKIEIDRKKKRSLEFNYVEAEKEAIANIKFRKKPLVFSVYGLEHQDMLYRVKSNISENILFSLFYGMFCPKNEEKIIMDYYKNVENNIWKLFTYKKSHDWKISLLDIDEKYIDEIEMMLKSGEISKLECNNMVNKCAIEKVSSDNVMALKMRLIKNGGQWYWDYDNIYEGPRRLLDDIVYEIKVCELSSGLGNFIDEIIQQQYNN